MSNLLFNGGLAWIKNPKIILDLGARDFDDSIRFSKTFPEAKVYSFECNRETINSFFFKIQDNPNIILVPKAVREFTGRTKFFPVTSNPPPGFSPNIGASSLFKASGHMKTEPIHQTEQEVECVKLKEWCDSEGIREIDVIWMDIQGAELLALKGLEDIINTVKVIFTEVTYKELYEGQDLYPELNDFLKFKGFEEVYHGKALTCPEWFGEAVYIKKSAFEIKDN